MYLKGKILEIFEEQNGESPKGLWRKKEIIIETNTKVPRKVCLTLRGESINFFNFSVNDFIQANIDIESREFSDKKYFTEIRAWKLQKVDEENIIN